MADPNMSTETGPVAAEAPTGPIAPAQLGSQYNPVKPYQFDGAENGMVPLYDPATNSLKAVPQDQAQEFADQGWTVGMEAHIAALNNGKLAQGVSALSSYANSVSFGAHDALLSSFEGGRKVLRGEQKTRVDNPGAALLGNVAGAGTHIALGVYKGGGLPKAVLESAAGKGLIARYGVGAVSVALEAAPHMVFQTINESIAQSNLLDKPITKEQLTADVWHNLVFGAGLNLATHGVMKSASAVRKAGGKGLDILEKWGYHQREFEEIPHEWGPEGKPRPKEREYEREYYPGREGAKPAHGEPTHPDNVKRLGKDAGPSREVNLGDDLPEGEIARRVEETGPAPDHYDNLGKSADEIIPASKGDAQAAEELGKRMEGYAEPNMADLGVPDHVATGAAPPAIEPPHTPSVTGAVVDGVDPMVPNLVDIPAKPVYPPHYPKFRDHLPIPRKPVREPAAIAKARAAVEARGNAAELREFDAAVAREHAEALAARGPEKPKAAEAGPDGQPAIGRANGPEVKAEPTPKPDVNNIDFEWAWQKGLTKREKAEKLMQRAGERLLDAGEDLYKKFKKLGRLEKRIKAVDGTKDYPNKDAVIDKLINRKKIIRKQLFKAVPREVDEAGNIIKPGYKDYHDEYRRIHRNGRALDDIADPVFQKKGAAEAEAAAEKAAQAEGRAAKTHEEKLADQHQRQLEHAVRTADNADSALANAREMLRQAEENVARLEDTFALKKHDDMVFSSLQNARARLQKVASYEDRIAAIAHREKTALLKSQHEAEVAAAKAHNAAELKRVDDLKKARDKEISDKAAAEKKAEADAKKKADDEIKAANDAKKAADDAVKAAQKKADKAAADKRRAERDARASRKEAERAAKASQQKAGKEWADKEKFKETDGRQWKTDEGIHTETRERTHFNDGRVKERIKIKIDPHAPEPTLRPGKIKQRWSPSAFGNVAKAGFFTGMHGAAGWAAGAMAADNMLVHMANHRKVIGEIFEKYAGGAARGTGTMIKAYQRGKRAGKSGAMSKESLKMANFPVVAQAINNLADRPEVVVQHLQKQYPELNRIKPTLIMGVAAKINQAVAEMNQMIPKKPFMPTLQTAEFRPTRAQQFAVLQMWEAMGNPEGATTFANRSIFSALDRVYPEIQKETRRRALDDVARAKKPIRGRNARQFSQLLDAPVRPLDAAAALKRTQQTAGPEPMKKPGQGPGGAGFGGGPKSAKITNQAVSRDAIGSQLAQMGN